MLKSSTQTDEITWHASSDQDVLTRLGTRPDGLSDGEVTERLQRFGANTLARSGGTSPWLIFWHQINNPIGWLLLAAGALAVALKKPTDAAVVFGAVGINAITGFIQEYRTGKAIEALAAMIPEAATAPRNGQSIAVSADVLMPGDVVTLQSGDKVPADLRLLRVKNLLVEEAALTGESLPVAKRSDAVFSNPAIFIGIGILLLLQACFIYLPPLQALFASAALDARAWLYAMAAGAIVLPAISLDKWIRNRL